MTVNTAALAWEYREFTYRQWQPDELWCCLTGAEQASEHLAQEFIWKKAGQRINAELTSWFEDGWECMEPIGPQGIIFHTSTENSFKFSSADVFLWIITLGIGLLAQLAFNLPRQYVVYKPVEFRAHLMKCHPALAHVTSDSAPLPSETARL